jgi:23S rRNA pseudouridine1911/1915/1917 synthase
MKKYHITAKNDITLIDLLSEHLPATKDAATIITGGGVWCGRKKRVTQPEFLLKKGDTVRVYISPLQGLYYNIKDEQVVFEDDDLLVVYKPNNLNVHSVPSSLYYNLSFGVGQYLKKQGITMEPTPLMRLDRPVDGLVLFAKNKKSERDLFELIRNGKVKKWYVAALDTDKKIDRLKISDIINNEWSTTKLDPQGKKAVSRFVRCSSLKNANIYSVFPSTGRRHQIRFHAAHYLSPIIGDTLYGSRYRLNPEEIALMCRGYNFFTKGKNLRIRVSEAHLEAFVQKLQRARYSGPED